MRGWDTTKIEKGEWNWNSNLQLRRMYDYHWKSENAEWIGRKFSNLWKCCRRSYGEDKEPMSTRVENVKGKLYQIGQYENASANFYLLATYSF